MAAQVIVDRKKFLAFIDGFGNNIEDLMLNVKDNRVYGAVDTTTHYCSKSMSVMLSADVKYRPGKIYISDVAKVITFLKASSQDLCIVNQWDGSLNLKLEKDSLVLPSHTHIRSAASLERANFAIKTMIDANFTKIGPALLDIHGHLNMKDIRGLSTAVKIAGKDAPCRVKICPTDKELVVTVGHVAGGANVNRVVKLNDVSGKEESVTHFGSHLPQTLACMSDGMVDFHMGANAALILQHHEHDDLLVLKHQQGVS
jgi:hypothetical protein